MNRQPGFRWNAISNHWHNDNRSMNTTFQKSSHTSTQMIPNEIWHSSSTNTFTGCNLRKLVKHLQLNYMTNNVNLHKFNMSDNIYRKNTDMNEETCTPIHFMFSACVSESWGSNHHWPCCANITSKQTSKWQLWSQLFRFCTVIFPWYFVVQCSWFTKRHFGNDPLRFQNKHPNMFQRDWRG